MEEVFSRTEQLLGREKFQKLRRCHVMVLGAGGVGSHCMEALARAGVGRLTLVDSDRVAPSNINRQSIALLSTVGRYKTEVMKEKIRDICPDTQVECPDYIVDAIDTVSAKIAVAEKAREYKIPLISSMGTGNKLHGELFQIGDLSETSVCPLCRVMRRELKKRGIEHLKVLYSTEKPIPPQTPEKGEDEDEGKRLPPGSISFVPPVAGLLIAGEVVRDLLEL